MNRTNTGDVQRLTSKLLKHGVRVLIEHVRGKYDRAKFRIAFERRVAPDLWGNKFSFPKEISKDEVEDAYVKTIEHLYQKEIINKS